MNDKPWIHRGSKNCDLTPEERFWEKVDKRNPDECWNWLGGFNSGKRPYFKWNGKQTQAHRVVYEITKGVIPPNMCVCHSCDNPSCVNPNHLFIGTITENNLDMFRKGRNIRGRRVNTCKLTEEQVREIRCLYQTGNYTFRALGKMFPASKSEINYIIQRKSWSWLK